MRVLTLVAIALAVGTSPAHGLTVGGPAPTLAERLQQSAIVIRGHVVGVRRVDAKPLFWGHYADSLWSVAPIVEPATLLMVQLEFDIVVDRVFKGCVRRGELAKIQQPRFAVAGLPQVAKGDTSIFMLRGTSGRWSVPYNIPLRNGRPGVETQFREWSPTVLEARIDSMIATQLGDSVLSDLNQTLHPDYGSITGEIVSEYYGLRGFFYPRGGIEVAMDNGRTATSDSGGRFHLEGRTGAHTLNLPGTTMKPKKVHIPAGCFEFVQITIPR